MFILKNHQMDRIIRYKSLVKEVIQSVLPNDSNLKIPTVLIEDEEKGHYLLYNDGWQGERRIYGCYLHIEVKADGKVWLQHDGTDLIIGERLLAAGIPKEHIVLGFHAPIVREDTGFAVA